MPCHILIVDDHEIVRRGVRSLLSSRPEWQICGEAVDGIEAVEKTRKLRPAVVLMDISMPRMGGMEATRIIRRDVPETKVIILSQNDPAIARRQAQEVNAVAFVAKSDLFRDLIPAVTKILGSDDGGKSSVVEMPATATSTPDWLAGGGELSRLIREHDWSQTSLGPIEAWPQSLKTSVNLILNARHPMWVGWGKDKVFLYNDAYLQVLSLAKHPWALGRPTAEVWPEIWDICGPLADKVFDKGEASFLDEVRLLMNRGNFIEETYYSFSYSPIRDESGAVAGLFCPSTEVTPKVINARRLSTLSELSSNALLQKTTEAACTSVAETLSKNPDDVPFALLYLIEPDGRQARLVQACQLTEGIEALAPELVELSEETDGNCLWPLAEVMKSGQSRVFSAKDIDGLPLGVAQQRLNEAMVLPVTSRGEGGRVGLLVAGVSPARPLDAEYRTFYELVAGQIATAIQNARAAEEERARIEALAEIDRAKTAFFSNVSHEFRTPLTLMLGPVEDLLAKSHTGLSPAAKTQLELVNRNGSRLLRLVNTLLDFSRIEAGRMQAVYQRTDLAAFTIELASVFRSATEKAGLQLKLDCPKLSEPVFVDRGMWEKIVLNLISNAFKFTFEGQIAVTLAQVDDNVELRVRDTGVGIPDRELSRLFDRFHRIENTRSRTHEGSGIGLALVQELVKLHRGTVRVESVPGKGSTFIVSLPLGSAHLPADRIGGTRSLASTAMGAAPFVEEALRWLPDDPLSGNEAETLPGDELIPVPCPPLAGADANGEKRPTVLVADDNSDMRQYVVRLLAERYEVIAVPDGQAALASAQEHPPDLVLSDVMMPNLDGFGLLRELRADPKTRTIPIILLSARAGEESRVEGMERGADDYLIKPFSARELLARVQTHLQMARIRKQAEQDLRESEERATNIIESIADGFMVLDRDWRIAYLNQRAEEIVSPMQKSRANLPGKVYWDEFPGTRGTIFEESYRRAIKEGAAVTFEAFYPPLERWFDVRAYPGRDGLSLYFLDITERKLAERTPSLLASIVGSSDDAIISKNLDGMITSWNKAAERMFGYSAEEALGRHITLIVPPEQRAEEFKILERLRRGERIELYEAQHQRKDGTQIDVALTISPVKDGAGRVVGASKVARDITERKRAEERERRMAAEAVAATAKFRAVFEQTPVFAGIMALDGKVIDANRLCLDACGYRAEEVLGHYFWETGWWGHSKDVQAKIKAATVQAAQGTPFREILSYHWADGTERVVDFAVHPIVDHQGHILFLHPTGVDITDLKRAEENYRTLAETLDAEVRARTSEVVQQSEQLRDLSSRLMQAQDEERRHIARELHDSAGQILAALGMSLAQAAKYGNQDPARFAKGMDESQDLVQQLSQEIRTMSYLLHPPLLDETGLSEALRWYIQGLADRSGLEIALNIPEDFDRLPREMELVMFRLVQECLTNIHRHSGSKKATIQIARKADSLVLDVQDEGAGISQEKLAAIEKQGSGVGIRGMRERVRHVGGNMQIQSNAGGTKITFTFPLTKPSAAEAGGNGPQENSVQPIQIAG